jgi:hypothetical protein
MSLFKNKNRKINYDFKCEKGILYKYLYNIILYYINVLQIWFHMGYKYKRS